MSFVLQALLAVAAPPETGTSALARLVGRCWEGEVAPGALNIHCFESIYEGAHVRDRHQVIVDGEVVYAGETVYSAAGDGLEFTYWNVLGGVGHGTGTVDNRGVCFSGTMRARPQDLSKPFGTCWRWQPDGGYVTQSSSEPQVHFRLSARRF